MKATATTQQPAHHQFGRRAAVAFLYLCAVAAALVLLTSTAAAQGAKPKVDPKLKPRPVTLKTKDGIRLRAYYFPSDKEKSAIPVILIHEWQGQGSPYVPLVVALRDAGCAVLVPEYRGHGGSKEYIDARGKTKEFNVAAMGKADVNRIISADMEAAKSFLKEENNKGNLNLNALVVVGIREGAVIGANWTVRDWSFAPVGSLKRGQDVKALVMISPSKIVKGVPIDPALGAPAVLMLPLMVVSGTESEEGPEADRMVKRVEAVKKRIGEGTVTGLEVVNIKTSLSGPALINESKVVIPAITKFIQMQVKISDDENPWVERQ